RRTGKPARRSSRTPAPATSDEKPIAQLTRELGESLQREKATSRQLSEALERETATSHILGIISSSPSDLDRVFDTILANASRLPPPPPASSAVRRAPWTGCSTLSSGRRAGSAKLLMPLCGSVKETAFACLRATARPWNNADRCSVPARGSRSPVLQRRCRR